jgi:hypothetical protein
MNLNYAEIYGICLCVLLGSWFAGGLSNILYCLATNVQ